MIQQKFTYVYSGYNRSDFMLRYAISYNKIIVTRCFINIITGNM